MELVRQIVRPQADSLTARVPHEYRNCRLEVLVFPAPEEEDTSSVYNFDDLVGKLKWRGDSVKAQRDIRDEW